MPFRSAEYALPEGALQPSQRELGAGHRQRGVARRVARTVASIDSVCPAILRPSRTYTMAGKCLPGVCTLCPISFHDVNSLQLKELSYPI
jgi:hypothetical protein